MEWVKWAIPLVVISVWILANLARIPREQPRPPVRRPPQPPPPPEDNPPAGPPRKSVTDVDRFLEEVNRRRREAAEQRRAGSDHPPPVVREEPPHRVKSRAISPTDVPVETRVPVALPVDLPLPRVRVPEVRRVERQPKVVEAGLPEVVLPVKRSTRLVDNTEFPELAPDAAQPTLAPTSAPGLAQVITPTAIAASATSVMAMLRDPNLLRAAFLMREIFEPPLCRRGPRRPGGRV